MNILITGATGLVGSHLTRRLLAEGHTVIAVTRNAAKARHLGIEIVEWKEPEKEIFPVAALADIDVVVHLAGEHIAATRWSEEQKLCIRNSRVLSTRNLVAAIEKSAHKPKAFICASAIGFYGDRGEEQLPETEVAGKGFLAEVCQEWEAEAARAKSFGFRVAQVRIGVVLANEGGALQEMLPIFKFGLGGTLGSGHQWFPWIHVDDVVGIIHHTIINDAIQSPINAVAPTSVTNHEFTQALAATIHRPAFFFVPNFALRIGLGEMAEMLLSSVHVIPEVAVKTGYEFKFSTLSRALSNLLEQ